MRAMSSTAAKPAPIAMITARALIQTRRRRTAAGLGRTLVPSIIMPSGWVGTSSGEAGSWGGGAFTSRTLVAPRHDAAADGLELNRLGGGRIERGHADVLRRHDRPRP